MNVSLKNKHKILIGVTGGFGTGKSLVCGILKGLGADVIDADQLAHACLEGRTAVTLKVKRLFGERVMLPDGSIDRRALARIVFRDTAQLSKLNALLHPQVIRRMMRAASASRKRVVALDIPLLFEAGLDRLVDLVVVVRAPRAAQIERLRRSKRLGRVDILRRIRCQMPLREKVRRADVVIDNSRTVLQTRKQIVRWWNELNA